ncbi:MAG: hemerythrin domain-containing protein [Actinomycetota bacterium]|nr:hemerythrin domain-containing protein [Actinomycetota bacterium]
MDAIKLLKADHRTVEKLFKAYEAAGDRAFATKAKLVESMISELSVHASIEEMVFYPAARRSARQTTSMVLESLEEHLGAKRLLADLEKMEPKDERFNAKVTVLMEQIRHHVSEEEEDLFPAVADALSEERLKELGEALESAKATAPTRPHPHASDTPPGNAVTGLVAGAVDRTKDVIKGAMP